MACVQPWVPPDALPVAAPVAAESLWVWAESCTGRSGDVRRVQWYVVEADAAGFQTPDGRMDGWWVAPHHIYLSSRWRDSRWLIRHEMIHDLTQSGSHGAAFDRCGVR